MSTPIHSDALALIIATHSDEELALGYMRYEHVRKMKPRRFSQLHKLSLTTTMSFDDLVDEDTRREVDNSST